MSAKVELSNQLKKLIIESGAECIVLPVGELKSIDSLYSKQISALIADSEIQALPTGAWYDLLGSLAKRVPIFILGQRKSFHVDLTYASRNAELLHYSESADAHELVALLKASGVLQEAVNRVQEDENSIPLYHPQVALQLLRANGALSVLTINASSFRKIAIDAGVEAYQQVQETFHRIMIRLKGTSGSLRTADLVMRRSAHSNTYYVFLEQSRMSKSVPAPGVLENMADRIALRLQKDFWDELLKPAAQRRLPEAISISPEVSVGYSTALYNPCVDAEEMLETMLENALEVSKVQVRRMRDRSRELIQTLIQAKDILYPNFQAVFHLPGLTKDHIDTCKKSNSIACLKPLLFGFESLIRLKLTSAEQVLMGDLLIHLDNRMFRPDILFALAHKSKVALELDQVCMSLGITQGKNLPGRLMVNILPRNLIHIERLMHLISARKFLIFELSESEGISNKKIISRVTDYVHSIDCSLAADDFGKGHASIERIIQVKPEIIKLDRSLVDKIHLEPSKRMFVEGIVRAAKHANSLVLAEGIELWEEAEVVQKMGIDLIQGFLCHRPQTLEHLESQLGKFGLEEENLQDLDAVA